ncbi:MAG: hypothetical protein GXP30_01445 [Verrucomicrobia bacterium]|nr:hypothetical protein [Verrucomicrobiota bacterium]
MNLSELLESLTGDERNFIAGLDHGDDRVEHREQLDIVISNKGTIDAEDQLWYPYSVIEMGKNVLYPGHDREFAACVGIVLHNVLEGADKMNNVAQIIAMFSHQISTLSEDLRDMINGFVQIKDDMLETRRIQLRAPKIDKPD